MKLGWETRPIHFDAKSRNLHAGRAIARYAPFTVPAWTQTWTHGLAVSLNRVTGGLSWRSVNSRGWYPGSKFLLQRQPRVFVLVTCGPADDYAMLMEVRQFRRWFAHEGRNRLHLSNGHFNRRQGLQLVLSPDHPAQMPQTVGPNTL